MKIKTFGGEMAQCKSVCFCKGPGLSSQHLQAAHRLPVTLVPGDLMPSSDIHWYQAPCRQNSHTPKNKIYNYKQKSGEFGPHYCLI